MITIEMFFGEKSYFEYNQGRGQRNPGSEVITRGLHYLINLTIYPQGILNNVYRVALRSNFFQHVCR